MDWILTLDVGMLREELIKGSFTSVDLVHVFGDRCQTIGRELCFTTEELFEKALDMARRMDKERVEAVEKGEANLLPIMHGIPMSFKDQIDQKGHLSTCGVAYLAATIKEEDSVTVKLFLKAGAIPLVRGNVPQSCLSIHTSNFIFGEARNPIDHSRICGGSSGGDAGMLASRCIPLSVGTDIGGSVRIPAGFCGVYGFKPT